MTETLHIYDEFRISEADITVEQRHQKRTALEPLVFNILRKKYGADLEAWYVAHPPPSYKTNDKCLLIIERRIHPNLEFVLHTCAYFAKDWSICFLCSSTNIDYCKTIAGPWKGNIHFWQYFTDSPNYIDARNQYNSLLKSVSFWKELPWEMVGIVQTDSYFLRTVPTDKILALDFLAAPAAWDTDNMVGGMSFRRPSAMERICSEFPEECKDQGEDVYFSHGARALALKMPSFPDSVSYISESCFCKDVFGTHQWWTYLFPDHEESEFFMSFFLTLDMEKKLKPQRLQTRGSK